MEMLPVSVDSISLENAMVALVLSAVLLIQNHIQGRKVTKVESTLTTTNGGSHVKDQLNRIEKISKQTQDDVTTVVDRQNLTNRTVNQVERKIADHIDWSDNYVREMEEFKSSVEMKFKELGNAKKDS